MKNTTTLQEEIKAAKAQEFNSGKWHDIRTSLEQLREEYGNEPREWQLVRTAFHGGGHISTHHTATEALVAARRETQVTDCTCGCVCAVPADAELPNACETSSPYAAAR